VEFFFLKAVDKKDAHKRLCKSYHLHFKNDIGNVGI